ncbi:N-acetylmuramoyl-L-alanine amidase [Bacillus xiapuensis]|uniref:N-acetylmuramoyl-L-alanine amidase n=1 Tax=Bacillus xiapuensis TaxID=2014075 RepID=UPI000C24B56D|nr:N-acetylmuramoyl-L-alanine amidase [Bacillus xiapuensis]
MKRISVILVLTLSLIGSLIGGNRAQADGFIDVPHRALKEVNFLAQGGIVKGSTATWFGANHKVNRAEAVTFIGRAIQLDGRKRATSFKDVESGSFASGYIQSAVHKGIVSGVNGELFMPGKAVTRGEMAQMITKAFGYPFDGTAAGAAKALLSRGIAKGMADGSFGAEKEITRMDFAVFLARAVHPQFRVSGSARFEQTYRTTVDSLNVRTGPSTAYPSISKLSANTNVAVSHSVGGWSYIKAGNTVGFVSSYYLRPNPAEGGSLPAPPSTAPADKRLAGQTIIIDPGHGGHDPGAIGFNVREKDVVLATALKVNKLFQQTPFQVKMTRSTDRFITIDERYRFAQRNSGNVFVSIHANAASPAANGTETYYSASKNPHVRDSRLLAEKIQKRMVAAWKTKDRGVKTTSQLRRVLGVLDRNTMPAALTELGFITNRKENDMLKSDYWQTIMAKAIYAGILDYYAAKGYDVQSLY